MGIKLSTLSLTARALESPHTPTTLACRAREVATDFISRGGNHYALDSALAFLRDEAQVSCEKERDHLVLHSSSTLLTLPSRYGLKGGAAREQLIDTLRIRLPRAPRDIDVVRHGRFAIPADEEVARTFMPRDFEHGARVELIRDLSRYLSTRDVTINELAVFDSTISISIIGLLDSIGHTLRPSLYRGGSLHRRPTIDGRILLKMVRLYAEGTTAGESWSIVGIPEETSFSEFDLAIHLNKAFQRGKKVAEDFLHSCLLLSLLPAHTSSLRDTLNELGHLRHGERGLFPDVPMEEWNETTAG